MTLFDMLEAIPRFVSRHMFPLFVEDGKGELHEVHHVDFRNGCAGTVLVCDLPNSEEWDDDLIALRDAIREEWDIDRSDAARVFDPAGDVISVESAYRLLNKTLALLEQIYE